MSSAIEWLVDPTVLVEIMVGLPLASGEQGRLPRVPLVAIARTV